MAVSNMKFIKNSLMLFCILGGVMIFTQTYSGVNQKGSIASDSLMIVVTSVNSSTVSSADGYVKLQITGGVPPYSCSLISASFGDSVKQFQGPVIELNNLIVGGYVFVVVDSRGNNKTQAVIINLK
jgi:hypothetical protein